ncbi:MAG TPA: aminotransferase class V-fold PLP-dependent enzyme [Vicinamibacteria bacterium]|jgi:kynureninase|nr:aminotransferase class V-fold PLP-dependent enzyme [Vicinamibacteria bacterium]
MTESLPLPSADPLLAWRREFPILERSVYLVSHSLGAMPRGAADRLAAYADAWATRGVRAWAEGWWHMPLELGDTLGRLLGAPPGSVVMLPNVSLAQAVILSCFDFQGPRNKIVYDELNFPSVMYVYEAQRAQGARIETVKSEDGITVPLDRLLAAIDEHTLLVPISHVLFKSAFVQDVAAITRRAHEVGALVVADVYQSAGTVPVDVTAWEVDFATGGSVKWLCGGPGAGYLYVAPHLRSSLEPRLTGWAAHARPFAFEPGPIAYSADSSRFMQGTPPVPALYAAEAGYEIVSAVGVDSIRSKSLRQVQLLLDVARERGLAARTPAQAKERGGMVVLDVPAAEAVTRELLQREILVDYRPGAGIRLSPHFYTTDDEIRRAISEIGEILDSGAHRAHAGTGGPGF